MCRKLDICCFQTTDNERPTVFFDPNTGVLNHPAHCLFFHAQIRTKFFKRDDLVGLFVIDFFDGMMDPQALPITLAGDPGDVFGINTDSAHLLYFMYALSTLPIQG